MSNSRVLASKNSIKIIFQNIFTNTVKRILFGVWRKNINGKSRKGISHSTSVSREDSLFSIFSFYV